MLNKLDFTLRTLLTWIPDEVGEKVAKVVAEEATKETAEEMA